MIQIGGIEGTGVGLGRGGATQIVDGSVVGLDSGGATQIVVGLVVGFVSGSEAHIVVGLVVGLPSGGVPHIKSPGLRFISGKRPGVAGGDVGGLVPKSEPGTTSNSGNRP
jgi:hypothetical protein